MNAKELRAEAALTERSNDGGAKFALQYDRSKSHDAGTSAFKGDTAGVRPCAVIGPDRVVPPARDGPKKTPVEPWLAPDSIYRRLPDYPYKMPDHKDPTRNISPRQTFQENMQRIIMPPGYTATKLHEDSTFASKNTKLNVPTEVKYCEVPYNINQVSSDQKHIRNADHSASNVNPLLMRGVPHGWPAGSVHIRPLRTLGAPEVMPYPDYANCTGPRPVLARTHAPTHEEQLYPDPYYHESNIRFKPYPNIKERYPPSRYEYLGNYPSPYHPPNPFAHKYELPKTMPHHSYPGYPQIPKYTERLPEPIMDGYQRALSQQGNYGVPIRNPVHSTYRPGPGNHIQNKLNPYPPDAQHKPVPNKMPYDPASKMYFDYDTRSKPLPMSDNYYLNDLPRPYHGKNTIVVPNFASPSMHGVNAHPYYIKENISLKNYEYPRYKNMDPSMINHSLTKLPPQFSPSTLAISPADSNASNETAQTHGTSQEDCGYVSQSSGTSVRSIESLNRIPMDPYGRYDYRYGPIVRAPPSTKPDPSSNQGSKSRKDIRQFISSWSEGDDENAENNVKRDSIKNIPDDRNTFSKQYESASNQEQLYVLGLVNVPSEELSKYEHIQKVSKLPENIKGYNSLELLNQFEEAIESSNITNVKPPTPRAVQMQIKNMPHKHEPIPRALSPLDVEAKISQSVIHKEVGCNFEIKPCSPKMMNVEVAAPMQILNERVIEKVTNPHNIKSPIILQNVEENLDHTNHTRNKTMKCPIPNTASSCKMINSQHLSNSPTIDHLKTSYTLQDLESNSGVCLASLPRLDTDIELNFPEVNQQFINANKADSVITTSFTKDLPTLDVDRSSIASNECDMNYQYSPKIETETDFSRLSKYRKLKRCLPDENDTALAKLQATRVDSVIIKNPDNMRSLEENIDNTGSNFKDDLQEFAMNLVSQTKQLKHQHDVDKMFETSTHSTVTGRYNDVKSNLPSSFVHQSSSSSKDFNVIEEATSNNAVHEQTENHTESKDLSNRYLGKTALAIPMNLSPQARYSTIELDEEIRNIKTDDKTTVLEEKHQLAVNNTYHKKEINNDTAISGVNLNKPNDNLISNISDSQCPVTHDDPLTKPNTPGSCVTVVSSKEHDIKKDEKFQSVSRIEDLSSHTNTADGRNEEKTVYEKVVQQQQQVETAAVSKVSNNDDCVGNIHDDEKEQDKNASKTLCFEKINHRDTLDYLNTEENFEQNQKNHDTLPYVPKLKRKKFQAEITHKKRCFENKPINIVDHNDENKKVPIPPKVDIEDLEGQLTLEQAQKMPHGDVEETHNRQIQFINKECDIAKNATTECNSGMQKTENGHDLKKRTQSQSDVTENISQTFPDDKNTFAEKIFENEIKAAASNDFPLDIDRDVVKCNENSDSAVKSNKTMDFLVGSRQALNTNTTKLANDLIDPKKDFLAKASINHAEKGLNVKVKYNKSEAVINNICSNNANNDVVTLMFPNKNKDLTETKQKTAIDSVKKDVDKLDITDQNKEPSPESNTNISTTIGNENFNMQLHKSENQLQKCILCKDDDRYDNVQMSYNEDIPLKVRSKCKIEDELYDVGTKSIKNVPVYHVSVNKELFSPRFQNLLFYNENFDICSDAGELKLENQSTLTYTPHNPVNKRPIYLDDDQNDDANKNTENCEEVSSDGHSSGQIEIIDKACKTKELKKGNLLDNIFDDTSIVNYNPKCIPQENYKELFNLSPGTQKKISNETVLIPGADTCPKSLQISVSMLPCQEMVNKSSDENKNSECKSDFQITNNNALLKPVDNTEIDCECVKELKKNYAECGSAQIFKNEDTFLKPVDNSSHKTSSPQIDDKNSENNNAETESDYQYTNNTTFSKSVDYSGYKSIYANEKNSECLSNLENDSGECETDSQFTSNIESETSAANIIVIDESMSVPPEQCDEYSKIATPLVSELDKKIQSFVEKINTRPRFSLKRSLSDSALNAYDEDVDNGSEKRCMLPTKRRKHCDIRKIEESHLLNILQSSRRNSVSTLNNDNFSFCILIDDHCIVAEETYEQDNFMQLEDHLLNHTLKDPVEEEADQNEDDSDTYITKYDEEKNWVEDVGCEETIVTEDIAENIVIGDPASPKDTDLTDYESDAEDVDTLDNEAADHTSKVKHIYGDNMCTNDAEFVDALYRTPQMDVNKRLMDKESHITEKTTKYYDSDSLEMLLAEPVNNIPFMVTESNINCISSPSAQDPVIGSINKSEDSKCVKKLLTYDAVPNEDNIRPINSLTEPLVDNNHEKVQEGLIHSCESSLDDVFSYVDQSGSSHKSSSSPEVSSTTSEEKNSSILLKISNFKGSRISEVKGLTTDKQIQNSCKHTTTEYFKPDYSHGTCSKRPLLTKAAQKYIPPLRESIPDLKVKLALPQQSLLKLQKNKVAKDGPKFSTRNNCSNNINFRIKNDIPKKIKPKFEDVLKNIDEAQFQMHKAKNKKSKKYIPKVVIKKSENGSHYASTCAKESFNPDLTGRKWQPWVFIEKNKFIDNMALRNKTRAVFSHRMKSFVLAEKFRKYKSISTAKFVISQPKLNDFSTGNLKYTIKLKQR